MLSAAVGAVVAGGGTFLALGLPAWEASARRVAADRVQAQPGLRSELAAADLDIATWVTATIRSGLVGAGVGAVIAVLAWGVVGPLGLVLVPFGVAMALALRRRELRQAAEAGRKALRAAALEFAELVSLAIGAGLGVPAGMERAGVALSGAGGARLGALSSSGSEPWAGIEALGAATSVAELSDLGRTLAVGVAHQARTREVLLGWAGALRASQLEESEADAAATTEAMTGPLALVAFGFLLSVGVPAVLQLLGGVSGVRF